MRSVGVRELKEQASRILEEVREKGEEIEITRHGKAIARLVPVSRPETSAAFREAWSEMDRLAEEIARYWPEGVTAAQAVSEGRREL